MEKRANRALAGKPYDIKHKNSVTNFLFSIPY